MPTTTTTSNALYLCDTDIPVCQLEVKKHFETLTDKEKLYAHFISRASWHGQKILSHQLSEESPLIYELLLEIFTDHSPKTPSAHPTLRDLDALFTQSGISPQNRKYTLEYAAQVFSNAGNFRSFGDTKFIPRVPVEDLHAVVKASGSKKAVELFEKVKENMYAVHPEEQLLLGFPAAGHVSGYYSKNISKEDVTFVQDFLTKQGLDPLNTRLFKSEENGVVSYEVHIASAQITQPPQTHTHESSKITIHYGDFAPQMSKIAQNIRNAIPYAANPTQTHMLEHYALSFETGSIESHKESQRYWIKDVQPVVETNIGFIETYRDPAGIRAEWEGFVAVVNKERTRTFDALVEGAPRFVGRLPWPKEFEKDQFNKPDFTSLEVLTFATTGTPPAGINIPNYDDIRQTLGFKNVSLGNVLNAKAPGEKVTFIAPQDLALYEKYRGEAFEVQVGLHELLGHGSGKLLMETSPGEFNFDPKNPPLSPITNKPVETYYKPGETWGSVFKAIAASYEECRAESVAMYLCEDEEILKIFGFEGQEAEDVLFVCYLNMARAGLMALEFYDPKSRKWGQAHMQARFAILRVLLESGCVTLSNLPTSSPSTTSPSTSADGPAPEITIHLDRTKIKSHGVPAVGSFLTKLNIYKATADSITGSQFYNDATKVEDVEELHVQAQAHGGEGKEGEGKGVMMKIEWGLVRNAVLERKQPRKVFVQGETRVVKKDEKEHVEFVVYEASLEGVLRAAVERGVWY
ncbi:hypothetical protein HK102_001668 [Quaeritorhiza haematococci]|nr:hypothetical protein HK102_001668 [Quaeritorhiza haematococci]